MMTAIEDSSKEEPFYLRFVRSFTYLRLIYFVF